MQLDFKNKFAATSWMSNIAGSGGGGSRELMNMNAERAEEN